MFKLSPYVIVRPARLGSITPSGTEVKETKEKANVTGDSISKRKHNHSIALAMLNIYPFNLSFHAPAVT